MFTTKEGTMQATERQIAAAAKVVEAEGNDFSFGKPDERDFVRMIQRGAALPQSDNGDPELEAIADELYEDMGETVQSAEDMARFVLARLTYHPEREPNVDPA